MKKTFLPLHLDKREIYAGQLAVQNKGALLPAMKVQPKPQYIPLSFSQQRLWFIHRFQGSARFQSIRRMMAHFKELLNSVVKKAEQSIGLLPMLSHQEVRQLPVGVNATSVAYPQDKTIISLIEEQVIKTPDNLAVVFEDEELSYNDLNERSNQLAHYLRSIGVKDGTLVPVCIERGIDMLTGILGILKSGAAYVPIDPEYPGERILYLLEDTRSSIILSNNKNASALAKGTASLIITMDGDQPMINLQPSCNLSINIQPNHLAYVIYTSGSTGKPKGVMIEHTNLLSYLINNKTNYINDGAGSSGSFIHLSYTFDASLTGMFMPLLAGKAVVISSKSSVDVFDDNNLQKYAPYDFIKITPSHLELLQPKMKTANGWQLTNKLVIGGEALLHSHFNSFIEEGLNVRIVNEYGPTEATVGCSVYSFDTLGANENNTNSIPIGKPIDNVEFYILSDSNELSPVGVTGELCIAGAGLARGYLNQPVLTANKFVKHPFSKQGGARMYKTGDLAKWLPDGNIEYLGRTDEQVKIRGYRIELGEIESTLQECTLVKQAVVLAKTLKDGGKLLVAYVVPVNIFDKAAILSFLENRLPEYMVPLQWVEIETLPLTINSKIDRKALDNLDLSYLVSNAYVAPRNPLEAKLAKIWQQLFQIERVGIRDNFFELGGHSLLATRLISAIRKELEVELAIKSLFTHFTIAALAAHLETQAGALLLPPINAQSRPEHIPLSFSQKRVWFIDQMGGWPHYHIPTELRLKGKLDIEALSNAIQQIINRHEILRTVIRDGEGQGYQYIKEKDGWRLPVVDGSVFNENAEGLRNSINQSIDAPFNLSKDYMLRAVLFALGGQDHILVVTLHHIASDGWSSSIIVNELMEFYNAFMEQREVALATLPVQYADYAIWQGKYLQGEVWDTKIKYWKDKLEGINALQLPTDYPRPLVESKSGDVENFKLDQELSDQLRLLSHQQGATLFMTLFSAFYVLLYRYSGQQDICIGTPIAGRQQQELEGLIGFFVNTLALRCELIVSTSFRDFLQQVKATTLEAYDHQEVPFEKVVELVMKERDLGRSPLFQVMLVLQNTPEVHGVQLANLQLSKWETRVSGNHTSKFELSFIITETVHGLDVTIEYCTSLYNGQTIKRMIGHFTELLKSVVKMPETSIGKLPMLTRLEQQQLLFKFNNTPVGYPKDKTIIDLFQAQAAVKPNDIALVFESEQLTYLQLNDRSSQLAGYLQKRGVKAGTLVPICIERGIEMVVGLLAILKAGGAYVPVEPNYPADRISFMLEDTAAQIVLCSRKSRLKLPGTKIFGIIEIDGDWLVINKEPADNLQIPALPDDLAYVIYTSGSTGKPKGVMVEHKSLAASTISRKDYYANLGSVFLIPSFAFDSSVAVIFGTLITGGKLILCRDHEIKDPASVKRLLEQSQTILCVPSYYRFLLEDGLIQGSALSNVILAGEKVEEQLVCEHYKQTKNISLYNEYGPTEATVWCTISAIEKTSSLVTIGKPIRSVKIHIVNTDLQFVPIGVTGELCIGGVQVARGYLNLPELTEEKFITNPFNNDTEERIYKTGDLARWLPDGNIEYMGRIDDQVKIRGYRIELGGIERVLQDCATIHQAVVLAKEDKEGNKRLVGYIVPESPFNRNGYEFYLKDKLPEYMIPALWVQMECFPLTNNGKINKNALPEPDTSHLVSNEYVAPHTELEENMVKIWCALLGIEVIGIRDNFFSLGGHSLLAMRLVSAIRRQLEVDISINDLFIYPTVAGLTGNFTEKRRDPSLPAFNIKYLVPIRSVGDKIPLYIVAGAGGTALRFKKFGESLEANQPIYVLQPPIDSNELKKFPGTIEGIATIFIEEILVQNPTGPYALSGHCLGGIIAFEMAGQLQAMGKKVHLLAMFDTIIQETEFHGSGTLKNLYHLPATIRMSISKLLLKLDFEIFLLRKHTRQSIRYKMNSFGSFLKKIKGKKLKEGEPEYAGLEIFDESAELYAAAYKKYKLSPFSGAIVLYYANEHYFFLDRNKNVRFKKWHLDENTKNSWKKYATSIAIHEIEGEHSEIFDPVHGNEFALSLQQHLNNAGK